MCKWFWCFSLLILFSLGCAVNTNKNTYSLNNLCTIRSNCCGCTPLILLVNEVTASPGYDTDQMLYMECPYLIKAYSRNKWLAAPNQMLTPLIAQQIRNACFFRAVVTPPFSGCADYRLETQLLKLQQEFICCPSQIRMILHAAIIKNNCILREKIFSAVILAPENNPYGGVIAANKATQQILCQLSQFVIDTVNCNPCQRAVPLMMPKKARYTQEEFYLPPPNEKYYRISPRSHLQ